MAESQGPGHRLDRDLIPEDHPPTWLPDDIARAADQGYFEPAEVEYWATSLWMAGFRTGRIRRALPQIVKYLQAYGGPLTTPTLHYIKEGPEFTPKVGANRDFLTTTIPRPNER